MTNRGNKVKKGRTHLSIKIKELPELERPYEKLEIYGEKALSNAELLAIIIKTGTKEETSVEIAQKLLKMNDTTEQDLTYIHNLSLEELMKIKGIGRVKAIQLKAVGELAVRTFKQNNYKKIKIKSSGEIAQLLMSEMSHQKKEIVKEIILNSKSEILKIKDLTIGSTGFAGITIKEILTEPIKMEAPKIVIAHNHPSGDPTPSEQDKIYTGYVYQTAKEMGIELLDHIVIGNMQYKSLLEELIK